MSDLSTPQSEIDALARAKAEVEAARLRLHNLFMEAPALVALFKGHEGRVELFNPLFRKLWGDRPVIGKPMREAFPELEGQQYFEFVEQVFNTGETVAVNEIPGWTDRENNGTLSLSYFNFVCQATHDTNGEIDGVAIYGTEVTDQVLARQKAEQAVANLKLAQEAGKMGTWLLDLKTGEAEHSLEHDRIFGYADLLAEWNLKHFLRHVVPEDREFVQAAVQASLLFGKFNFECRIQRIDQQRRWILVRGQVLYDQGQPHKLVGVLMDMTESKQTEERLQLLQNLTAALAETLTIEQAAQAALREIERAWHNHSCSLYLLNTATHQLEAIAITGLMAESAAAFSHISLDQQTPATHVVQTENTVWLENLEALGAYYPHMVEESVENGIQSAVFLPLQSEKRIIGVLYIGFAYPKFKTVEDHDLLKAMARQCAQALERARLYQQAQQTAADKERQRLARDLHDAVSQTLFSATVTAESLPRLWERNPQRALQMLHEVVTLNRAAMAEMRTLLLELRPEAIVSNSLSVLLRHLTEAARGRKAIKTTLMVNEDGILPEDVHIACYRIAQEAVHNMLKHSQATELTIDLDSTDSQVRLTIRDNGIGFDPDSAAGGIGLTSMQERASLIGGTLRLTSQPKQGTSITLYWQGNKT